MDIKITHFTNPFSFFCLPNDCNLPTFQEKQEAISKSNDSYKKGISDLNHGEYVAVKWRNKWTRGVISNGNHFSIWLIDYGFYITSDDITVYVEISLEHKKYPTKVFEASIHGVMPLDIILKLDGRMANEKSTSWMPAAINRAKTLIDEATNIYFVPLALLTSKHNDIVIGDLYLQDDNKMYNIVDELREFPMYLEKNATDYVSQIPFFYKTRRHHRACLLKPAITANLPQITLDTNFSEYNAICEKTSQLALPNNYIDGVVSEENEDFETLRRLTPAEIERYSKMYVNISGKEYNMLRVILNKLEMCEEYEEQDLEGLGRGYRRHVATD